MTALVLEWFVPAPPIELEWLSDAGMIAALERTPSTPIAAVIGPAGPPGSGAVRIDQSAPAATWILPHAFGRVPAVQAYLASGEQVTTDIVATSTTITVTFAAAQSGFVIAA